MDGGQVITLCILSYIKGCHSYLDQGSYGRHEVIEKTYMLKSLGILEYILGGNVELLGEAWNNQG
jgi:hypothetical protein